MSNGIKKTFEDFTENDYKDFFGKQEKTIKEHKEQNKINSILLLGIGDYGSRILSNIKDIPCVAKFCAGTDKTSSGNLKNTQDIIKKYDYIIICTRTGSEKDCCLAETVADICFQINKRFMLCHTRDKLFCSSFLDVEKLSKRRSIRFINKMKKKKYLLNEIVQVDTSFVFDKAEFEYKGKNYQTYSFTNANLTYSFDFNCRIFANTVEYNIIKMLEL